MRTTLNLEDDAIAVAQSYAKARAMKLGEAVSELILRASRARDARPALVQRNGVWVLNLGDDAPVLTSQKVKDLLEDQP